MIETKKVTIEHTPIDTSNEIKKMMNTVSTYILEYNSDVIANNSDVIANNNSDVIAFIHITIYFSDKDNIEENVKKIMIRLYNLFLLYGNKHNNYEFDLSKYKYIFYLYSNPRRANQSATKGLSTKEYLDGLHNSSLKCFNTSSGVTSFNYMEITASRIEDLLGLLTHEVLHGCGLININKSIPIYNLSVNFTEAMVNMFAAIVNCYLISFEYNAMDQLHYFLLIELIHSINHGVKYAKLEDLNLSIVLNSTNTLHRVTLYQNASLYEYIIGKMLFFINFPSMIKNKEFRKNFLSLDKPWKENHQMDSYILEQYKFDTDTMNLINRIESIHLLSLSKYKDSNKICGNMLMQYYALDPMTIDSKKIKKNKYNKLYGGGHTI